MHQQRQPIRTDKLSRLGYFVGALLFHLVLFLMVATLVIWRPVEKAEATFQPVNAVKVPPPPPQPPSSGQAAQNPQLEPQTVVVPPPTPSQAILSPNSAFRVNATQDISQALSHLSMPTPQGAGLSQGAGDLTGSGSATSFGSTSGSATQLEGYLYDLKQTASRKPTGITPGEYHKILAKFVAQHWDEGVLATYYKSPKPLYTSAILIPYMSANLGPKAFGVEKEVEPSRWVVWYKGKIAPPVPGTYRFAGLCDDILLVRVDGRTVLDGSLSPVDTKKFDVAWNKGNLRRGEEISFSPAESKDIDIIIGEEPGGFFFASLFALKTGDTYTNGPGGVPKLPLFQIGSDFKLPVGKYPPVSPDLQIWQGSSR